MSRLWVGRCPGCGVDLSMRPAPPSDDLWCTACDARIQDVARTTAYGVIAGWLWRIEMALRRVADSVNHRAGAVGRIALDLTLRGERVAEGLLRTPGWFRGKVAD